MTNSSSWTGASTGHYNVHLGIWTNWSRGRIMGATLTLNREHGSLLIAFTALFVGLVSSCFWRILCLIFHRYASTPEPRDALHHQKQAILRNSVSAMSGLWAFSQLTWTWRRETKLFRTLPIIICAAVSVSVFTIAGGLSSQISSGIANEVLLNGANCGFLMSPEEAGSQDALGLLYPYSVLETKNVANYAQQCYANGSNILDCSTFVKDYLPGTTDTQAPCPFEDNICRDDANLLLDTGYIESSDDLGINTPPNRRVTYRTVLHCAPLVTEGYTSNISTSYSNYTGYHYGQHWRGTNYTYHVESLDIQYKRQIDSNQRDTNINFLLTHFTSVVINGSSYLPGSSFEPIPELFRSDGDLRVMFLAGNGVYFIEQTNDSWYGGNVQSTDFLNTDGIDGSHALYQSQDAASPMGCVQQYQFCNSEGDCGPLAGFHQAATEAAPLFNTTAQVINGGDGLPVGPIASQYYWYLSVMSNSKAFTILIDSLGAYSLASQQSLLKGVMGPLPRNQWQLDVALWWATSLAALQAQFVTVASGPTDPDLQPYRVPPENSYMQDICNNQKIRSSDYTSFSFLGLCFTYITGALIIALSFILEPILAYLQHRRRYQEYKFIEWSANGTLQLQRLAYQGLGSGSWEGYYDTIPKTNQLEILKSLPLSYPSHGEATSHDVEKVDSADKYTVTLDTTSTNLSEITESLTTNQNQNQNHHDLSAVDTPKSQPRTTNSQDTARFKLTTQISEPETEWVPSPQSPSADEQELVVMKLVAQPEVANSSVAGPAARSEPSGL